MKIGILSMQEIKNYGSFLQAYSLKNHIESLGHSCEFINIVPGEQLGAYKIRKFHKIRLLAERLRGWDFIKRFKYIYLFQSGFSRKFIPELGVRRGKTAPVHFDAVVIGSDEVFNCGLKTWFGFSRQLFGEGLDADKVITYAASFGATTLQILDELQIKGTVASLLGRIDCLSVRDKNSSDIVKALTGKAPYEHVDPVLIYDDESCVPKSVNLENYMIVYTYPERINNADEIKAICAYARSRNLKLVSIGHYFSWCDLTIVPHPFEVLAYFKHATCIVTDTFHGTAFSIKYNKPFCTIVRETNRNKLTHLLEQFDLTNRIVADMSDFSKILNKNVDFTDVNRLMESERIRSMEYLKQNLS